jgi:ketosteroid isomerase-like protein
MSAENVEIVRRIYDGFPAVQEDLKRGEFPIGRPFAEDVEWDASEMELPDLGDGQMRGREGVRRFWVAWLAAWESVSFEYELHDAGDQVVAVIVDQWMRGSEIEITSGRYAQVWTFKDGEVIHWKAHRDHLEALEAAGLAE